MDRWILKYTNPLLQAVTMLYVSGRMSRLIPLVLMLKQHVVPNGFRHPQRLTSQMLLPVQACHWGLRWTVWVL